jgi:mono/diheme cytochrome c family protein
VPGYRLVRLLGRGGFGDVWEAMAPGGVRVALKFLRLESTGIALEQRGLEVIRDLRHPHLVDVQFAVQVADCLVIAMSLCEQNLLDRLRACQAQGMPGIPRDELLGFMDDVAEALDFLNEPRHPAGDGTATLVGVQHRDVKPHNIFLAGGSARLADFGLAKILESTTASHTGAMSPLYVAPEVLEGRVTQWTDQYSLALTYCQLRTGKLPFASASANQAIYAHAHLPPDLSDLPQEERPIVDRALAKPPEERWPSCREFVRGLKEARPGVMVEVEEAGTRDRRPWRIVLAGLAAAAGLGLAAVLFVALGRRDHPSDPHPVPVVNENRNAHKPEPEARRPTVDTRPAAATATAGGDPARVKEIFRTHCLQCHGGGKGKPKGDLRILDRDLLIAKEEIVPGKPDESELYLLVIADDDTVMPPEDQLRLGAGEIEAIQAWIQAGAPPFPPDVPAADATARTDDARPRPGVDAVLEAILQDVRSLAPQDRRFVRYLSLDHLRASGITAEELELHRAALAKAINHLS